MSKKTENQKFSKSGLRREYLTPLEVLGQSVANIAPSATPALVIPLVFATAGNGTWLAYLFATIAIALVGANLNQFTRRSASAGSLYAYVAKGLGSDVGVVAGWALVLAYILTASAVLCGYVNYANVLFEYAGISIPSVLTAIVGAVVAWLLAFKDIKLSTKIMLVLEGISLALIGILAIVVIVKNGFSLDLGQLNLKDVSMTSIGTGLVLAFFSFVGFESASSLGDEAKKPLRSIPKAIIRSTLFVGVFFVILSYSEVLGFIGNSTTLDKAAAPLTDIATKYGIGFFGPLISIGALISFWACFLACANAGARILFSMGQHKIFYSSIGDVHESNKTPHIAITIVVIIATVVPVILIGYGNAIFDIYGWVGTIATYGFILLYALISIAAPVYLYREKELEIKHIILSVATVLILLIPIVGSIYANSQAAPYSWFIYIFIGWLVVGGLWLLIRKFQSPGVSTEISDSLETVHQHYRDIRANGDGEGI
ncbi:MAG TPA: APC family permease [Desulfosporosinus sp.]|nr:APC family permease [Desulfosporosinus sp.]